MAVIKEFNCIEHGEFDGTHPICPSHGCDSKHVAQEFRTPVGIGTQAKKRFDAGIRRSSDMMHISNFRTAREGETAHGGNVGKELGMELLWGNDINKKMNRPLANMIGEAQKPLVVPKRDGSGLLRLDRNNAMREAATEAGITRRRLPKAGELSYVPKDKPPPAAIAAITT